MWPSHKLLVENLAPLLAKRLRSCERRSRSYYSAAGKATVPVPIVASSNATCMLARFAV